MSLETRRKFKALEKLKDSTVPRQALLLEFRNQKFAFFLDEAGPNISVSIYSNPSEMFSFEVGPGGNINSTTSDKPSSDCEAFLDAILQEDFKITGHTRMYLKNLFDQVEAKTYGSLPWKKLNV